MPDSPIDPRDLDDIDREIRINELKHQAEELTGKQVTSYEAEDSPPEIAEQFWQNVVAYESAADTSEAEQLPRERIELPPPESLDDAALTAKLWEIISALAGRNTFLENTDHLNDRELYANLVTESLHEIRKDIPPQAGWNYHIDIIGSGSEEDIELHHRYYADDESRARWIEQFSEDVMPAREKPPYDRDRHLPKASYD